MRQKELAEFNEEEKDMLQSAELTEGWAHAISVLDTLEVQKKAASLSGLIGA